MVNSPNFTPEFIKELCDWMAEGKSVRAFCRANPIYKPSTICLWLTQDEEFAEHYARAGEMRGDAKFEDIDDIMDDLRSEKIDAQMARVLIDAVKWQAGKLKPKKYGDKMHLAGDDENPVVTKDVSVTDKFLAKLTTEQLEAIKAESADS